MKNPASSLAHQRRRATGIGRGDQQRPDGSSPSRGARAGRIHPTQRQVIVEQVQHKGITPMFQMLAGLRGQGRRSGGIVFVGVRGARNSSAASPPRIPAPQIPAADGAGAGRQSPISAPNAPAQRGKAGRPACAAPAPTSPTCALGQPERRLQRGVKAVAARHLGDRKAASAGRPLRDWSGAGRGGVPAQPAGTEIPSSRPAGVDRKRRNCILDPLADIAWPLAPRHSKSLCRTDSRISGGEMRQTLRYMTGLSSSPASG